MDENCYVEPIYKNLAPVEQLQKADRATLIIWAWGVQTVRLAFATACFL
jgi:hypothetical protein